MRNIQTSHFTVENQTCMTNMLRLRIMEKTTPILSRVSLNKENINFFLNELVFCWNNDLTGPCENGR